MLLSEWLLSYSSPCCLVYIFNVKEGQDPVTDEFFPTSTSEQNSNKLKELLEINLPKSEAFTQKIVL